VEPSSRCRGQPTRRVSVKPSALTGRTRLDPLAPFAALTLTARRSCLRASARGDGHRELRHSVPAPPPPACRHAAAEAGARGSRGAGRSRGVTLQQEPPIGSESDLRVSVRSVVCRLRRRTIVEPMSAAPFWYVRLSRDRPYLGGHFPCETAEPTPHDRCARSGRVIPVPALAVRVSPTVEILSPPGRFRCTTPRQDRRGDFVAWPRGEVDVIDGRRARPNVNRIHAPLRRRIGRTELLPHSGMEARCFSFDASITPGESASRRR